MKIVVLDDYGLSQCEMDWQRLHRYGDVHFFESSDVDNVLDRISGATAIFTNKTKLSKNLLVQCPTVKFIGVLATGFDVVDVKAAAELGIVVSNVPAYGTFSVAQFATALLLELCHHVDVHSLDVHQGGWQKRDRWCYWLNPLIELDGKTLGVIGFGRIGQAFAKVAQALGMNILAYDEYPDVSLEGPSLHYSTLDELYARADVISLHCPLHADNVGMVNRQSIEKMKPGVLMINTSRGGLVVEKDLAEALNSGRIGGAALDVLSTEPPLPDNPLLNARNCIITPHMAWATREARQRIVLMAIENLKGFIEGNPINVVNP